MKKTFENKELSELGGELGAEYKRLENKYKIYDKHAATSNRAKKARDDIGTKQAAIASLQAYIIEIQNAKDNTDKNTAFGNSEKKILAKLELLRKRRETGLSLSYTFWNKLEKFINHFRKTDKKLIIGVKSASIANKIHKSFFDGSKNGEGSSADENVTPSPKKL